MIDSIREVIAAGLAELATPTNIGLTAAALLDVALVIAYLRLVKARRRDADRGLSAPRKPLPWRTRLTYLAAVMASVVAAQGMFMFFKDVLGLSAPFALMLCSFMEVGTFASALGARDNLKLPPYTTGPEGKAVWVFASLSGIMSASHASSVAEAFGRLVVTLIAGWLWERSLQDERKQLTGKSNELQWAITPTRLLIRMGLADPTTRDSNDIARERRLDAYVRAIHDLSDAETRGQAKAIAKARKRWEAAYNRAVEYARVDVDQDAARIVAIKVDALRERRALIERIHTAPAPPSPPPPSTYKPIVIRHLQRLALTPDPTHPTQSDEQSAASIARGTADQTRPDHSTPRSQSDTPPPTQPDPTQSGWQSSDSDKATRTTDPTIPDLIAFANALLATRPDPTNAPDLESAETADSTRPINPTRAAPTVVFQAPPTLPAPDPTEDPTLPARTGPALTAVPPAPNSRRVSRNSAPITRPLAARRSIDTHREALHELIARGQLPDRPAADAIRTALGCSQQASRTLRNELRGIAS
ncbi:hypothetical protein ACIBG8_46835 [Nonomuraea sp. NPDC050556]|uniref:hypothetical protein n=1 Tax=Nonomuraea sp. NPDC050556 TaxID=3364369 RepID=UPI0037BD9913